MLFILLAIFIILFPVAYAAMNKEEDWECGMMFLFAFDIFLILITLVIILIVLSSYNATKSTADKQIQVLEEQNTVVLSQFEPIVEKYLQYERDTFTELKQNPQALLALSMYPELNGNEFVRSQIDTVIKNQKEITNIKLEKAKINAYRLWIFMGE